MTPKEAKCPCLDCWTDPSVCDSSHFKCKKLKDWIIAAESNNEKQVPKKPIQSKLDETIFACPNCHKKVRRKTKWRPTVGSYCDKCGQALDYSESK